MLPYTDTPDQRRAHDLSCGKLGRPDGAIYCPCGIRWTQTRIEKLEARSLWERFTAYGYEDLDDMYASTATWRSPQCYGCTLPTSAPSGRCWSCFGREEATDALFGHDAYGVWIAQATNRLAGSTGMALADEKEFGVGQYVPGEGEVVYHRDGRRMDFSAWTS